MDRSRVARQYQESPAMRFPNEHYSRWDDKNRKQSRSYEETERILRQTGRMPRPMRMRDIGSFSRPIEKTIVASKQERRAIAEMVGIFDVTKLQAKLLLRREYHPVWGHERIMVYGKLYSEYLQPDANTNDPMEMSFPLKFKAAFREDYDPFFPTKEKKWNDELERRNLRPDVMEGKAFMKVLKKVKPEAEVPENMFVEAILDNVLDLGELVLQHFACHVDKYYRNSKTHRMNKMNARLSKRISKDMGIPMGFDIQDERVSTMDKTPQELHDAPTDWIKVSESYSR